MFCLSIALDYMMVLAIHFLCLFGMLVINAGFALYFHMTQRKGDIPFKHWANFHKKPYKVIKWMMLVFNFKLARLMYSNLFKKEYFNAAFDNRYATLIKPLFIASMVNFLL